LTVGAAAVAVLEPSAQPAHQLSRADAVKPIPGIDSGQDRVGARGRDGGPRAAPRYGAATGAINRRVRL